MAEPTKKRKPNTGLEVRDKASAKAQGIGYREDGWKMDGGLDRELDGDESEMDRRLDRKLDGTWLGRWISWIDDGQEEGWKVRWEAVSHTG